MDMNIDSNIIKERSTLSNKASSKNSSIFSSTLLISYHQCMEINNKLSDVKSWKPIDSFQLSYKRNIEVENSISIATDKLSLRER